MKKSRILIVNGFSSGMMFVAEAKRLGYECYHLTTPMNGIPEDVLKVYLARNMATGYDELLEQNDDFDKQLEICRKYNFDAVIPGTESGVLLAEKLADALSLPCNDISLTMARRDKYYMQKCLEEKGVPGILSTLVHNADEAVAWYRDNHLSRVAMKPRMDAGGIGFHDCSSEEEIRQAFGELYGRKSCFGEDVDTPDVLMQEFVTGTEIIVDHVSHNGVHELTDLWVYDKDGAVYHVAEAINRLDETYCEAVRYTHRVLDALGIRFGPTHSEIMLTEKGPVLIETGARLMGHMPSCDLTKKAFGYSIIEKALQSYLYPVNSSEDIREGHKVGEMKLAAMFMCSYMDVRITGTPVEEILNRCRYVAEPDLFTLTATMQLVKTIDLVTIPGYFYLLDKDEKALQEWMRLYFMVEREHPRILYRFEDDVPLTEEEEELKRKLMEV